MQELSKILSERIVQLREEIGAGTCKTFDEYKYRAGRIAGLIEAEDLIDEAQKITQQKLGS